MKIVNYETFIRMPAGTIFAPFTPCVFLERFEIKVDAGWEGRDGSWRFNGTLPLEPWNTDDLFEGCDPTEAEFEVYDGDSTDASRYKLFCVLEPDDVKKFINVLHWALDGCPGEPDEYTHDLTKKVEEWENLWHQLTDRTQIMTADEIHNMSIEIRKKEKEDDQT